MRESMFKWEKLLINFLFALSPADRRNSIRMYFDEHIGKLQDRQVPWGNNASENPDWGERRQIQQAQGILWQYEQEKFLVSDIQVFLIFKGNEEDDFDKMQLEKYIKDRYQDFCGRKSKA